MVSLRSVLRTLLRTGWVVVLAVLAVTLVIDPDTSSAQLGSAEQTGLRITRTRVTGRTVHLTVSIAPDSKGVLVSRRPLPASAFTVHQAKTKRAATVRPLDSRDLEVVVVAAGAPTNVGVVRNTVSTLVKRLPKGSKVAVVSASPSAALLDPMSADHQSAVAAAARLRASDAGAVLDAVALASRQFSSGTRVRRTLVVIAGVFASGGDAVRSVSEPLIKSSISTYVIRLDQESAGAAFFLYPLPLGGGQIAGVLNDQMVAAGGRIVDELLRQYEITFESIGGGDLIPIALKVRTPGKTLAVAGFAVAHGQGNDSAPARHDGGGGSLGLRLGGLALALVAIIAVLYLPVRWARARAARRPAKPLLLPSSGRILSHGEGRLVSPGLADRSNATLVPAPPEAFGLGGEQVEGAEAVRELLRAQSRQVRTIWVAEGVSEPAIEELANGFRVPVRRVPSSVIASASRSGSVEGVIAHAAPVAGVDLEVLTEPTDPPSTVVVLDHLSDASLGSLIRTGVTCGVTGVVLARQRSSPLSPTATAIARGAIEHVRMALVSNLPTAVARLRARGFVVVGIESEASQRLLDLDVDFATFPVVLVIDGGGQLEDPLRARCDVLARVDLPPGVAASGEALGQRACVELARRRIPGVVH